MIRNLIIPLLLLVGMATASKAQETQVQRPQPKLWFGVSGAANFNYFTGTTQKINSLVYAPTAFHKGSGVAPYGSLFFEYRPNPVFGLMFNLGYDNRSGSFDQVIAPCNCPADLDAKVSYLTMEPSLRIAPFSNGFYVFLGGVFSNNFKKSFDYFQEQQPDRSGDFSDMRKWKIGGQIGAGYDIPISSASSLTQVNLSPFIAFQPYFGQAPRSIESWTMQTLRVGLALKFGKAKDADMDGVSDSKDNCPDTPAGVAVDDKGCPVDTDGDGIADYLDACPNEAGLVALKGCPDKDKDGVADKDDSCPDVAGLASLKGCPDTDGDGVADKDDKCPGTKKGDKVDASGCPIVLDTDNDGVADSEDKCPTVAGPRENKGCPVIKEAVIETVDPEMTIEPVYFDYDKSNILQVEKAKIEKLVKLLKSNGNYNVDMTGNADNKGTEEYNMKLSERRIESVIKAITSSGVKAVRVSKQKPLGESSPAATNDTEEGRALNRRVTIEVIKTK